MQHFYLTAKQEPVKSNNKVKDKTKKTKTLNFFHY